MTNYFRITAYYPKANVGFILDSYGKFEKLWQFSSALVYKGCKILEVGREENFAVAIFPKAAPDEDNLILRACAKGQPTKSDGKIQINGRFYFPEQEEL